MADLPTAEDLFRRGRDEILSRNSRLTREVLERSGSDANVQVAAMAAIGDEVVGALARVAAGLFLDSAKGEALERLIFDRFNLPRKEAVPAVTSVEFSTTAVTTVAFSIPKGTQLATADGKQFVTDVEANFPINSKGPVFVAARSTRAGADQQSAAATIVNIRSTITGAPADLAVTNSKATTGAADAESEDSYRARARLVFETARRGTVGAIRATALAQPGVETARVFEAVDASGREARTVQLVISDAFAEGLVDEATVPVSYQTQSQLLASSVFAALSDTRAAGIYVDVLVAAVRLQSVQLGLSFQADVDVDTVAINARSRIVQHINALSPGDDLTVAAMVAVLREVNGLVVSGDEIISPTGTIVAAAVEVLRTTLGLVTAQSVQPDRALQSSANPDAV